MDARQIDNEYRGNLERPLADARHLKNCSKQFLRGESITFYLEFRRLPIKSTTAHINTHSVNSVYIYTINDVEATLTAAVASFDKQSFAIVSNRSTTMIRCFWKMSRRDLVRASSRGMQISSLRRRWSARTRGGRLRFRSRPSQSPACPLVNPENLPWLERATR